MKITLITGSEAYEKVCNVVAGRAEVLLAGVDIASLLSPRHLKPLNDKIKKADLVLLPGYARGDFSRFEEGKTKIRLGPRHHSDLPWVMDAVEEKGINFLSTTIPADVLLELDMRARAEELLIELEDRAQPSFTIGGVKIGGDSRPKVLAEIVDAPLKSERELDGWLARYRDADIIDIGVPLDCPPGKVRSAAEHVAGREGRPFSVDTLEPELAEEALEAGAQLVLSANRGNAKEMVGLALEYDAALVVIPEGTSLKTLVENIELCRELGAKKILADPILSPAGLGSARSIARCVALHESMPELPLFMGCGNVTELMDADGIGANALLAAMGAEVGAAVLFTLEASNKTVGSVAEVARASRMAQLARSRGSPLTGIGLDLLVAKEKHRRECEIAVDGAVEARRAEEAMDPHGPFKIGIIDGRIVASHNDATITGDTPAAIIDTAIELGLISSLQHAAYLGRELEAARVAIALRRSYVQDEPFQPGGELYSCGGGRGKNEGKSGSGRT